MHILTPLIYINRHEDNTLVESQLSAHASNHCGFRLSSSRKVWSHSKRSSWSFYNTLSCSFNPYNAKAPWATRVLYHHIRLKVRPNISKSRVDETMATCMIYSTKCEPLCAADSASTSSTTSCTSGTHHTTEMIEAFLTLSLFTMHRLRLSKLSTFSWHRAVERVSSQRKSLWLSSLLH